MSRKYTSEDHMNAAIWWHITGNAVDTSKATGIPDRTIRDWTQTDWWAAFLEEAKSVKNEQIDSAMTRIIEKSAKLLEERLDKGDVKVFATGLRMEVPVPAKELSFILNTTSSQRHMARQAGKVPKETTKGFQDQLTKVNEELEKRGKSNGTSDSSGS